MGSILDKLWGKKKESDTVLCMNIYPKERGGVKYESMPVKSVSIDADRWLKAEDGKYYYLNLWDEDQNKLVPYYPLPEVITVSSDMIARVLSCPYLQLKRLKMGILGELKNWIPFLVLGLAVFFLIVMKG